MGEVNMTVDSIRPAITPDLPIGRPCKYETHVQPRLDEVYMWLCNGMTDYSIADSLGVSHETLIEYKKRELELIEIYSRARTQRNFTVVNAMYGKASGGIVTVKQQKMSKDGAVIALQSEIYTPPDVNAADLYLRNNMPGYVQARQEGSSSVHVTVQLPQIQAEIDKLMTSRQTLEAELARIDALPDAGIYDDNDLPQGNKPVML